MSGQGGCFLIFLNTAFLRIRTLTLRLIWHSAAKIRPDGSLMDSLGKRKPSGRQDLHSDFPFNMEREPMNDIKEKIKTDRYSYFKPFTQ